MDARERIAFLDVDTQVDFLDPSGKLHARGAEAIKPNLARLVELAQDAGIPLVSSVDAHRPGDPEFAEYPPHCLVGTAGQEKVPETSTGREVFVAPDDDPRSLPDPKSAHVVLEKQVFPVFGNRHADAIFRKTGARVFYVFGVVTEVCVRAAALGLLERGYEVLVVEDAIWPIEESAGERAKAELRAKGARFTTTDAVTHELAERETAE
jgi:nicotinamidase/pyrazinamidase